MLAMQMLLIIFFKMLGMDNVHWTTYETRFVCKICFRSAELKELTNSQSFSNGQPRDEISVLSKVVDSSLGSTVAIGGCLHKLLNDENLL